MPKNRSQTTKTNSVYDQAWKVIDRAANKDSHSSPIPIDLTFDGDKVHSWYHPALAGLMCDLCGKKCREEGKLPCVLINPYCG